MIILGISALLLFIGIFFFSQYIEVTRLKNYAKKIIQNSEVDFNNKEKLSEIQCNSNTNIYWYNKKTNCIETIKERRNANDLKFLEFKYFKDYISSTQNKMKTFKYHESLFLFAPINIEREIEFLVFERTTNRIESIISKK